jgi:hypothetical protein
VPEILSGLWLDSPPYPGRATPHRPPPPKLELTRPERRVRNFFFNPQFTPVPAPSPLVLSWPALVCPSVCPSLVFPLCVRLESCCCLERGCLLLLLLPRPPCHLPLFLNSCNFFLFCLVGGGGFFSFWSPPVCLYAFYLVIYVLLCRRTYKQTTLNSPCRNFFIIYRSSRHYLPTCGG